MRLFALPLLLALSAPMAAQDDSIIYQCQRDAGCPATNAEGVTVFRPGDLLEVPSDGYTISTSDGWVAQIPTPHIPPAPPDLQWWRIFVPWLWMAQPPKARPGERFWDWVGFAVIGASAATGIVLNAQARKP